MIFTVMRDELTVMHRYEVYRFPTWAIAFGWFLSLVPLTPIPVFFGINYFRWKNKGLPLRTMFSVQPSLISYNRVMGISQFGHKPKGMRLHLLLVILFATCRGIRLTLEENQDLKKTCGAPYLGRARRSIGGVLSSMEQYPWIVAVYSKEGRQSSGCTGTLLSNRHVLTAAHCVVEMTETLILRCKSKLHSGELSKQPERDNNPTHTAADPAKFQIYVGNQCNNPLMCKAKHRLFTAKNISYHQLYDPCRDHSDIAIITLEETVSMDEAHPICLATEDLQPTGDSGGPLVFTIPGQSISNWDLMERLKKGVAPIEFCSLRVTESSLEGVTLEADLSTRRIMKQAVKVLETLTVKVSGFSDPVRVHATEAKSEFPSRHDWDLFFMKNKLDESKPGERPDTIYIAKVPIKWFSPSLQEKGSDLPSEALLKTAMETFGKVRRVDIPACDEHRKEMDPEISGIKVKGFVFGPELFFEAYVQYEEYSGFVDAMDTLRNMKWTKRIDEKVFHANVKVR
ncbi:unnamed protein product [Nippostrongylus brasiliensis]|uniref:A-kinase anchor protein 17A (inferred by orthology to a human protein) n=1 Tax=Nippostrongylus brasiliensis TaxID=27835 RepID=A0A0N4YPN2_NIPBR|nr:unnamed protein product [Nippostrongylus brasiliensis]